MEKKIQKKAKSLDSVRVQASKQHSVRLRRVDPEQKNSSQSLKALKMIEAEADAERDEELANHPGIWSQLCGIWGAFQTAIGNR